ncbi:response regulator transcription factor [Cyanobacteria bacterium FACHB-63]|nr:response regulator transcription factor [Cyanobacteria bacterium FACHB-63]
MVFPSTYILLLAPQIEELHGLESLLQQVALDVEIVDTTDQALARVSQNPPCLVILQEHLRSEATIHQLRTIAHADRMTLVIVTETDSPSWLYQEQHPDVDGFLVKPLSPDVLFSLIHSASARQYCQRSST